MHVDCCWRLMLDDDESSIPFAAEGTGQHGRSRLLCLATRAASNATEWDIPTVLSWRQCSRGAVETGRGETATMPATTATPQAS